MSLIFPITGQGLGFISGIIYNTIMKLLRIVLDTNVIVSALRSRLGASHRLLLLLGDKRFQVQLSVALLLEYEAALKKPNNGIKLSAGEKDDILDYLCSVAQHRKIHYLWRPTLKDPGDDMVLELAVASGADAIVTFNKKDFTGMDAFKLKIFSPQEFLGFLGGSK
jgi:putative PIN family toxin of toxin-antitoxin system